MTTPARSWTMRRPDVALALIRVVVGLWFFKSVWSKLTWSLAGGFLPIPTVSQRWIGFLPTRLAEYVENGAPGWYKSFLVNTALPNGELFAKLTAVGEVLVGVGLLFGILTVLASLGGLWLILNYFIASLGGGLNPQGFHVLLITCFLVFILTRAGRRLGFDGWLLRNHPRSFLARLHLS
ncbi:MAG: DoxX family protein [Gemmatimonadota bacterium]